MQTPAYMLLASDKTVHILQISQTGDHMLTLSVLIAAEGPQTGKDTVSVALCIAIDFQTPQAE